MSIMQHFMPKSNKTMIDRSQICEICMDAYENHAPDFNIFLWELIDEEPIENAFNNKVNYQEHITIQDHLELSPNIDKLVLDYCILEV